MDVERCIGMDDIVSKFIVGTCRMFLKSNISLYESMRLQDVLSCERKYMILCGSIAEFFIRPLHLCTGDVDLFKMKPKSLAFTQENPVMPPEFRHIAEPIDCLLMEPYEDFPAFVRLRLLGQVSYNWEYKAFEFIQADEKRVLEQVELDENDAAADGAEGQKKVGPAYRGNIYDAGSDSVDIVQCVWCPQWPNEAREWPNRQRNYGWPTTSIIQEVVQNGCHVVLATHPACRNDVNQFRLSFSVAEVILLQSWTPIQQIVYHILRYFAKRELIIKDCPKEDEVLCTYHLKTLMLWSCEKLSPEWWISSNAIELCCKLLKELANWLKRKRCPNYFIPEANLFHEHLNHAIVSKTAKQLNRFCDSDNLCLWFVEHYMQPNFLDAACNYNVLSAEYLLKITEIMKAVYAKSIDDYFSLRFSIDLVSMQSSNEETFDRTIPDQLKYILRMCSPMKEKFYFWPSAEYESCYRFYELVLHTLYAVHSLHSEKVHFDSEICIQVVKNKIMEPERFRPRSYCHNLSSPFKAGEKSGQSYFLKAQYLMENLSGSSDDRGFLIVCEVLKKLLRTALECEDSRKSRIVGAIQVYLAALHFVASEYQIAMDICLEVIRNERSEKDDTEPLNAACLLFVKEISYFVGFYLIFRRIRDGSWLQARRHHFLDLRLTPEVLSHYLAILSIKVTAQDHSLNKISQLQTYPLDAIFKAITNRTALDLNLSNKSNRRLLIYRRTDSTNRLGVIREMQVQNDDYFVQLLIDFSLDKMTSFYDTISKDFGIDCNTVDSYRAAFLYRCSKYNEVMHLCERILNEPDLQRDLNELAFANVMVLSPLDLYFDTDIQCLLGLHTLIYYLSLSTEKEYVMEGEVVPSFHKYLLLVVFESRPKDDVFSNMVMESYKRKSHYFLRKHFLARYLRVRCLIDFNDLQAVLEFEKIKASLPFEQLISCFLQKKLLQFQRNMSNTAKT